MYGDPYLPPGCPNATRETRTFTCRNTDCGDYGDTWDVDGIGELGTWTPDNEEATRCPTCDEEGE